MMRFKDKKQEITTMVELVCLILSSGAICLQIWVLSSNIELLFKGEYNGILAGVILSGVAFCTCLFTAWTTTLNFSSSINYAKTNTYSSIGENR